MNTNIAIALLLLLTGFFIYRKIKRKSKNSSQRNEIAISEREEKWNSNLIQTIPDHRKSLLLISSNKNDLRQGFVNINLNKNSKVDLTLESEPSIIFSFLAVQAVKSEIESIPKPQYFPSYWKLTPKQRWIYINWLCDISKPIDPGYVFLYYYGLERQLLYGDFERSLAEIIALRRFHKNKSFQVYSATAIIHSCIARNRFDVVKKLYLEFGFDYFGNEVLMFHEMQGFDIQPNVLLQMAIKIKETNKLYIKRVPEDYLSAIETELNDRFKCNSYPFVGRFRRIKTSKLPAFANYTLSPNVRIPDVPDYLNHQPLRDELIEFFKSVHEKLKAKRKNSPGDIGKSDSIALLEKPRDK